MYAENMEALRLLQEGFSLKRTNPKLPHLHIYPIDYTEFGKNNLFKFVNQFAIDGEPVSYTHLDVYKRQTKDNLPMEEVLWKACDALRGSIEPSEYKHVVLSLIFLKYAGFHFEKRRQEIVNDGLEDFVDNVEFYAAKNVFYLPETARWPYLKENSKQPNIASIVDKALSDIEKENKPLRGALPNNYYSSLGIEAEKLGSLLDKIDGFDTILEDVYKRQLLLLPPISKT